MSLLARFNDGECRAWFAAVLAIRSMPDPRRGRHDATSYRLGESEQHEAHTGGAARATARLAPWRT